jgi:sulfoxide reductase catalytic subunit YedY
MLVKVRKTWDLPESAATPESVFLDRRRLLAAAGFAGLGLAAPGAALAQAKDADPSAGLYPARRNAKYVLDRDLTDEKSATNYNNFYEFGTHKYVFSEAQRLPIRPWTVKIDGMVGKPMTLAIDDLLAKVQIEERLYRHRCVEAWSMAVPWSGFPLSAILAMVEPQAGARYVRFETFENDQVASGQRAPIYPWPYVEGITVAEAANELSFMVTGMYGKPVPKQNGAPLRLALPWKYGFKSIKSIVRIEFTDKRPKSFWEQLQASEYGFWANVNPQVPHPRWSQADEEVLGTGKRVPTLMFNGYGEFVADLYKGIPASEKLYM